VTREATRFWGSAAAVALAVTALAPLVFPFRAVGLDPETERIRLWLLVVFTTGVLLILFGSGALIAGKRQVGVRDVVDAGGVREALERADASRRAAAPAYTRNAALWCIATGGILLVFYFALWGALG
jgi:hypothetical protein